MNPKDPVDRAILTLLADVISDLAALRKLQLELAELTINALPAYENPRKLALLSELEQGLAVAQSQREAAVKLKANFGL